MSNDDETTAPLPARLDAGRGGVLATMLGDAADGIARRVTEQFIDRHPDWVERYGEGKLQQAGEADALHHVQFLAGAAQAGNPDAFADYARWAAPMLEARQISSRFLLENLEQVVDEALDLVEGSDERVFLEACISGARAAIAPQNS